MKHTITICVGSSCFARGNAENVDVAEAYIAENGFHDEACIELGGILCRGRCAEGPIVIVDGQEHTKVNAASMLALLQETLPKQAIA